MRRRSLALGVIVLAMAACTSWHPQTEPAATVLASRRERARVTLDDGSRVEILWAQARGDTLYGQSGVDLTPVTIPLFAVQRVEVHGTDMVSSVLTGFSIVVVALAVATVVVLLTTLRNGYDF